MQDPEKRKKKHGFVCTSYNLALGRFLSHGHPEELPGGGSSCQRKKRPLRSNLNPSISCHNETPKPATDPQSPLALVLSKGLVDGKIESLSNNQSRPLGLGRLPSSQKGLAPHAEGRGKTISLHTGTPNILTQCL